uniref:Uncharacterized protein n=1 Tax=Oryza sativa subsp. japonica TaxID=39947 RepID=Q8LIA1_ORYSJ|nr:hypothetical protein [Oryza sativa Japonica Group]
MTEWHWKVYNNKSEGYDGPEKKKRKPNRNYTKVSCTRASVQDMGAKSWRKGGDPRPHQFHGVRRRGTERRQFRERCLQVKDNRLAGEKKE